MLSRQRTILRMLASAGPSLNKIDMVKLLFLLAEENPTLPRPVRHEFVPYHRGPYSFTLAYDLSALEREGMILHGIRKITITDLGKTEAEDTTKDTRVAVDNLKRAYGALSTNELIDRVYGNYAWYTAKSKWIDRRAVPLPKAEIAIYTTGYEEVTLDGLLNRLLRAGVQRLIDVRSNPVARRFGFHKSTLARICPKLGIEYIHVPEVGVPSTWRSNLDSPTAYQALFVRYADEVLPNASASMECLIKLLRGKPSALMCKEADPKCCHRTTLAEALSVQTGLKIQHLGTEVSGGLF